MPAQTDRDIDRLTLEFLILDAEVACMEFDELDRQVAELDREHAADVRQLQRSRGFRRRMAG